MALIQQTIYLDKNGDPYQFGSDDILLRIINTNPYSQKYKFIFNSWVYGTSVSNLEWHLFAVDSTGSATGFVGTGSDTDNSVTVYVSTRSNYDYIQLWCYDEADSAWICHNTPVRVEYQNVVYSG